MNMAEARRRRAAASVRPVVEQDRLTLAAYAICGAIYRGDGCSCQAIQGEACAPMVMAAIAADRELSK